MHANVEAAFPSQKRTLTLPERYRDLAVCAGFGLAGLMLLALVIHVEAGGSQNAILAAAEDQSVTGLFMGVP